MKLKLIALNVVLLFCILAVAREARIRWNEAKARREANLNAAVKPVRLPPLTSTPKPQAPPATKYADIATNDLFSKDRNPVVVVEAPKVEKPREMPHLPVVYGVLGLPSGMRAIMAEKGGGLSTPVREGDRVGEFKIVSLDAQNVTFEWEGKEVSRKIEDLMDRSSQGDNSAGARAGAPASVASTPSQPQIQMQNPQPNTVQTNNVQPGSGNIGAEIGRPGESQRACRPGDTSPAGTVVDGYKKTLTPGPFGITCRWVPAQ